MKKFYWLMVLCFVLLATNGCSSSNYYCHVKKYGIIVQGQFGEYTSTDRPLYGQYFETYGTIENTNDFPVKINQMRVVGIRGAAYVDAAIIELQAGQKKTIYFTGSDRFKIKDAESVEKAILEINIVQELDNKTDEVLMGPALPANR